MEELTIEQKAQRYDEAKARMSRAYNSNRCTIGFMNEIFPELKESEDERMIQYFKDLAPFDKADELYEKYGFSHKDAISWLEKQGGHAKFINGIQVGDKVTRNEDGVLVNLSQLNRVAKKQGEQKPADKVEPKFKVGDWVVSPNGVYWHIDAIDNNRYEVTANTGNSADWPLDTNIYHSFSIQDAKDGDVLVNNDASYIVLFKKFAYSEDDIDKFKSYCHCREGVFSSVEDTGWCCNGFHPATKEQRDALMKAMADAGYTFDFEKKELKKI